MKRILIQDKSQSLEVLDSIKNLVQSRLEGKEFKIETTYCLSKTQHDIKDYNLIIAHPHLLGECCTPFILYSKKNNIPLIFTYKFKTNEVELLEAIAEDFEIKIKQRPIFGSSDFYADLIKQVFLPT